MSTTGGFIYIRRFTYKKEDVDCKLCTEYRGRKKCPHKICPYITERIEAGAVTYEEAVNAMVHPGCRMARRLPKLILTYPDSFWGMTGTSTAWSSSIRAWAILPAETLRPITPPCIC